MIGLVLVTHGRLAEEFVRAMEHVVGQQERIATICIGPDDDMEERRQDIAGAIQTVWIGAPLRVVMTTGELPATGRTTRKRPVSAISSAPRTSDAGGGGCPRLSEPPGGSAAAGSASRGAGQHPAARLSPRRRGSAPDRACQRPVPA